MNFLLKSSTLTLCLALAACGSMYKPQSSAAKVTRSGAVAAPVATEVRPWITDHEARLREAVKGSRFEVERRGELLVVTAPVDSSFNPDRPSMLLAATLGPLSRVAKMLEKERDVAVLLLGHGDTSGSPALTLKLSQERAQSMAAIFRLSGLHHDRLMYKGLGADVPRASNASKGGRSSNRRVEMFLTSRGSLSTVLAQYGAPGMRVVASDQAK